MSSDNANLSYLIVEKNKLECIVQPLKSNRVKYTCFEVSQNLLILGATSGGLYVFRRDPCVFLQLIPSKEGPVNNISLSCDENLIAFSSSKGVTCVLEIQNGESRIINRSVEHYGSVITALIWSKDTNKLYLGDSLGRLSVINVSLFLNKNIFHIPAYMFMKLDSSVVQISCFEEYLLISTKTRCYICDTEKEQYKQIGNQLREGFYGATFLQHQDGFKIYCARPGSRLWEVDDRGNVLSTHQFKKALSTPPSAVVRLEENELIHKTQHYWPPQSFNFCSLTSFLDKYLLTFKSDGIYIFDPATAEVILWSDHYKDILMVKSVHDVIYVWNTLGQLYYFVMTPLSKCLIQLYFIAKYQLCINVLEAFLDHAMDDNIMTKVGCLVGLQEHFPEVCANPKVYRYIENLITGVKEKKISSNLDSGIFLVDSIHWKKWKTDNKRNRSCIKKKRIRSYSMTDISKMSIKTVNSNNKLNYASLPNIQLSLNDELKSLNSSDSFMVNCNNYLTGSFMNQIPFLSLTSPDIIQSTIIELGHNVKRKLFNSTKSLQNKFYSIEEKIKLHRGLSDSEVNEDFIHYIKGIGTENIDFSGIDDNVVYHQPSFNKLKNSFFEITGICQVSEKVNSSFNEEEAFILFNMLVQKLNDHNQSLTSTENIKKSFPFKQLLPTKNIEIIKDLFCRSLHGGWIVNYIDHFKALNVKYLEWQDHPLILQEIHKTEDLINDVIMSNIILIFSEILDPHSIFQCLENLKLVCIFFSSSIILDIFQESSFNFFASKKDLNFNYDECPLPYLLNMLFLMLRLDQIESACHITVKADVKLNYISLLVLKLSIHLEYTGIKYQNCLDRCNKLFLNFLMKLKESKLASLVNISNKDTLFHVENAFFSINNHLVYTCYCGYPLIGSAKCLVKYPKIGELLLKQSLCFFQIDRPSESFKNSLYTLKQQVINDSFYEEELLPTRYLIKNEFTDNFLKNNFSIGNLVPSKSDKSGKSVVYSKMITLLQTMPDIISQIVNFSLKNIDLCLPFIIQFGKIHLLDDIIEKGSYEFWEKAFDLNLKLSNGFCCICQNKSDILVEVDWNQLSVLALRSLGVPEAIKLMLKYADSISSDEIDISFFRACLLSDVIQNKIENSSALVDIYCNQQNFTTSRILTKDSELINSTEILKAVSRASHTVTIDFKTELCCYCSLPLISDKVALHRKIRIFKCDHVFHIFCLKHIKSDFECPLCKVNSL